MNPFRRWWSVPKSQTLKKLFRSLQLEQLEDRLAPAITGSISDILLNASTALDLLPPDNQSTLTGSGVGTVQSSQSMPGVGTASSQFSFEVTAGSADSSAVNGTLNYTWSLDATSAVKFADGSGNHYYTNSASAGVQGMVGPSAAFYHFHTDTAVRVAFDVTGQQITAGLTPAAFGVVVQNDLGGSGQALVTSLQTTSFELNPGDYTFYATFTGSAATADTVATDHSSGHVTFSWSIRDFTKPDIDVKSVVLDAAKKGVSVNYQVDGAALTATSSIQLYWASGPTAADILAKAGQAMTIAKGANFTGSGVVLATKLGNPPAGTKFLLAIADPDKKLPEADETDNLRALTLDAAAMFSNNAVSVVVSGASIKATFKPAGGALTVAQAAAVLGVDHFNWINTIQGIPTHWKFYQFDPARNAKGVLQNSYPDQIPGNQLTPGNIIDPVQSSTQVYGFSAQNDPNQFTFVLPQYIYDNEPFYYNESLVTPNPFLRKQFDTIKQHTTATSVDFFDAPFVHLADLNPGESWSFSTELVGVHKDKSFDSWDGLKSKFTWSSNAVVDDAYNPVTGGVSPDAKIAYFASPGKTSTAPVISGGIVGVNFDGGPVNFVPVLNPIDNYVVEKTQLVMFTAQATDANAGQVLTYGLGNGAPAGASIDPVTGLFTWVPDSATRAGTYNITITATDNGAPSVPGLKRFSVSVLGSTAQPGTATLLKNIMTGGASSRFESQSGNDVAVAGNLLYFMAKDSTHGLELWVTDGTSAGTRLIVDISPGNKNTVLNEIIGVGNVVYFTTQPATGTSSANDLWRSDGTAQGTVRLLTGTALPDALTAVGDSLFFLVPVSHSGTAFTQLWTIANGGLPTMLREFADPAATQAVHDLVDAGGKLFFRALDAGDSTQEGLWTSDGTTAGTLLLKNFSTQSATAIYGMTSVNGTLFFIGNTAGQALWKSDGTAPGTVQVADVPDSNAHRLSAAGGTLFLIEPNPTGGFELWTSNGSSVTFVKQITPDLGYQIGYETDVYGTLYFLVGKQSQPWSQLWRSDGTASGTVRLADLPDITGSGDGGRLIEYDDYFFFAKDFELWRFDTATGRIFLAADFTPRTTPAGATGPAHLTLLNDTVFFTTFSSGLGVEPWLYTDEFSSSTPVRFVDADGDVCSVMLRGPGRAVVAFDDSDGNRKGPIDSITLEGTDPLKSTLTVAVIGGGNGRTSVKSITGTGLLRLAAPAVDLIGNGINLTGSLGSLSIRDVLNGADILAQGTATQETRLAARVVKDGSVINVGSALSRLTAASFGVSQVLAPRIGSMLIRGNFLANVTVSGAGVGVGFPALDTAIIRGTVSGAAFNVNGDVNYFKAGAFLDSQLYLGYLPNDPLQPMSGGTLTPGYTLGSFSATRLTSPAFDGSVVAADSVGTVFLRSIQANNGGKAYGILGHTMIGSVTVINPAFVWEQQTTAVGDFHVQVI